MQKILLTIRDEGRAVRGLVEEEVVDVAIASLGAEPDTLEELEAALARYIEPGDQRRFVRRWADAAVSEPSASGQPVCVVDLPGRLVVASLEKLIPDRDGMVTYVDRNREEQLWLGYGLSADWLLKAPLEDWETLCQQRRQERAASPAIDARAVLYGQLVPFVVQQCFALAAHAKCDQESIRDIHRRWLTIPRGDLLEMAPRDWLLARRELIDRDLQDRFEQWNQLGECPPGLSRDSRAFRLGGFGTNEIVVYYDLCRELIHDCWQRLRQDRDVDLLRETARLENKRRLWLATPQEDFNGYAPAEIIERERQRLPLSVSGEEAMADCDCPLCQMMAESGPVFWNLDGSHMDEDFAFSFCRTHDEWESDQRGWDEFKQEFHRADPVEAVRFVGEADGQRPGKTWRNTNLLSAIGDQSAQLNLFALGGSLAELICEIKAQRVPDAAAVISGLNRDFANLRQAMSDGQTSLMEPVAARFSEHLDDLSGTQERLKPKCQETKEQLAALLRGFKQTPRR